MSNVNTPPRDITATLRRQVGVMPGTSGVACYVTDRGDAVTCELPLPHPRIIYTHTDRIGRAVPAHLLTPGVYLYMVRRLLTLEEEWIARRDRIMAERAATRPDADDPFAPPVNGIGTVDDYPPTPRHVLAAVDTFRQLIEVGAAFLDPAEVAVARPVASLPDVTFRAPDAPWMVTPQTDGNLANWWWDEPTPDQLASMQARSDHLRRIHRGEVARTPRPTRTMAPGTTRGGNTAQPPTPTPTPTAAGTPRGRKRKVQDLITGGLFADANTH